MRWLIKLFGLCGILAFAILAYGLYEAQKDPIVVQQDIELDGLSPDTHLRILLLADTHYGYPDMLGERLKHIVAIANAQKPDLILLAGDYFGGKFIDRPGYRLESALGPLAKLKAPMGVYAISGNHDSLKWLPYVLKKQGSPTYIDYSKIDLGPIMLVGAPSAKHGNMVEDRLADIPAGKPTILLVHEAERLFLNKKRDDLPVLTFGGHTHGLQLDIPFFTEYYRTHHHRTGCIRGSCVVNGWPVFVTSGLGTSKLPLRIGVPPEMVMINLYSTGRKSGTDR